jgi:hypothetical protein
MAGKKSVVVTGASSGIGWGSVKILVASGFRVYGSVRRQIDADRLQAEFGEYFTPLLMDVTDPVAVASSAAKVGAELGREKLFGLVNNAGIAVSGPLLHLSIEALRHQLEVNLIAPLLVTQAFAPLLGTDKSRSGSPGRIVNISSVAGRIGVPFLGAYVASKHALEGMSETLRRELLLYGIDVILIGPGSVATPIWDKAEKDDLGLYAQTDYASIIDRFRTYFISQGRKGFPPEHIGKFVYQALTATHPSARYAVVPQRLKNWSIPTMLPKRVLDKFIGKQLGLVR